MYKIIFIFYVAFFSFYSYKSYSFSPSSYLIANSAIQLHDYDMAIAKYQDIHIEDFKSYYEIYLDIPLVK